MRILVNAIPLLAPLTGVGKYILYLSKKLKEIDSSNDYTYFYGFYSKKLICSSDSNQDNLKYKSLELLRKTPVKKFLRKLKNFLASLQFQEFEVYFEPNFIILENLSAKKRVVTIHDFSFEKFSHWHPKERVEYFSKNFWSSIRLADRIIVPSAYIMREAIEEFNFDGKIIDYIYHGVDFEIFKPYPRETVEEIIRKYSLPENYVLFVGSIEPRKNLKNLLLAYEMLPNYIKNEFKLVLSGFKGWKNEEIAGLIEKNKGYVTYTGYVSERELAVLYCGASLFVYPSFYEGFGFPPIEAMACGCPVVVSKRTSLPEVCGDGACYCDPESPSSIAETIQRILEDTDLVENLRKKGAERVKHFSWESTANKTLKIFMEVAT